VIAEANPANNGEAIAHEELVIPWEVESFRLFDPVTTEAKAEMAFTAARQIYERHKTPALQTVLCFNEIDTKTS
jgi:hypothetical protein